MATHIARSRVYAALLWAMVLLLAGTAGAEPWITRSQPRRWTLDLFYRVRTELPGEDFNAASPVFSNAAFQFETADIAIPLLLESASHEADPSRLNLRVRFNGFDIPREWLLQPDGLPDQRRLDFEMRLYNDRGQRLRTRLSAEELSFRLTLPLVSYETRFNEAAAMRVDWPTEWPEEVRSALEATSGVHANSPEIVATLNEWTNNRARTVPPAMLAKFLASKMVEVAPVQRFIVTWPDRSRRYWLRFPRGFGIQPFAVGPDTSLIRGIEIGDRPPRRALPRDINRIGLMYLSPLNEATITNTYVALLRTAGIPARVVLGIRPSEQVLRREGFTHSISVSNLPAARPRVWAEFFLYDERTGQGEWIPVDIARQRQESSRPRPLNQAWEYFGNHDELDEVAPMTSLYTPQGYLANPPAPLWGWKPLPVAQRVDTLLQLDVYTTPTRGGSN